MLCHNILSSKIEFIREFYADHNVSDTFDCKQNISILVYLNGNNAAERGEQY